MCPFMTLRRFKIYLSKKGSKKRDRTPRSFQDCIENTHQKKVYFTSIKLFVLFWFFGAVLYYVLWYQSSAINLVTPYLEVFPQNEVQAVTEVITMKDVFTYEKDPHRIKEVLKRAEKNVSAMSDKDGKALARLMEQQKHLPWCITRIRMQNISIHKTKTRSVESDFTMISMGGYFSPRDCRSRHKVGILVPYRDREHNLAVFLYNIHPFWMRQKIEYRVFVLEQYGTGTKIREFSGNELFNRGRLFNAGFLQVQEMGFWPCFVFHDVDLLPTDDRILYTCPSIPRHMCSYVMGKKKLPSYRTLFGGVSAMTKQHYRLVNGYSNMYWGWGGEDNDMFWRLKTSGLGVGRYSKRIARYTALPHNDTPVNKYRYEMLQTGKGHYKDDGLSNVHYTVVSFQIRHLYTHILIDINPRKENIGKLVEHLKSLT